jgi:hypothetical protein
VILGVDGHWVQGVAQAGQPDRPAHRSGATGSGGTSGLGCID